MSTLVENYIAVNEGKLAKSEFLRQSRQSFPNFISQFTSYDDAVKIFKNKGLLSEEVLYQCKGDKFPLEQIEKGIEIELLNLGINPMVIPSPAEYTKAKMKAIDNLCKDSLYYVKMDACCCDKCKHSALEKDADKYEPSDKMELVKAVKLNEARTKKALLNKDENGDYPLPNKNTVNIPDSNIEWTENRCKIAYIIAKFKSNGIQALQGLFGVGGPATREEFCFKVLGATAYSSQCAVGRMRDLIRGNGMYFDSAIHLHNFVKIYNELQKLGDDLEACLDTVNPDLETPVDDATVEDLRAKSKASKERGAEKQREAAAAKKDRIEAASRQIQAEYDSIYRKHHEKMEQDLKKGNVSFSTIFNITSDKINAEFGKWWADKAYKEPDYREGKVKPEQMTKAYNYQDYMKKFFDPLDSKLKLQEALKKQYPEKWQPLYESVMTKIYERKAAEDTFPASLKDIKDAKERRAKEQQIMDDMFDKLCVKIKPTKAVAQVRDKYKRGYYVPSKDVLNNHDLVCIDRKKGDIIEKIRESKEQLRKAIKSKIVQVLSEAATTNLAQLSDQNASIQGIPAVINSLENVVTEIESFILKEQSKIQGIVDNIGNIKNEDGIPIGYKFTKPILDSFKRDLEPVLGKISLDNIKLPQAPEMNDEMYGQEEGLEADEEKANIYAPKGQKPQLDNIK
jgi:hypothetical protein